MKILMLKFGNPFRPHGENNSRYVLAEAFIKLGHKVLVLGGYGHEDRYKLLEYFDVDILPDIKHFYSYKPNRAKLWITWLTKGVKMQYDLDPDLIIADGAIPVANIGVRIMRIHDVPKGFGSKLSFYILKRKYNYYVLSTHKLKESFVKMLGVEKNKCLVIPLPIDTSKYRVRSLSEREHAILFVDGRSRRNVSFAIEVFKELKKHDPDLVMYIVGKVQLKESINGVVSLGFVDRKTLRELYSRVKLLLIPTSYEGFGYPIAEACASGTPIVGSDNISEILVDGYNGFRIPQFNVQSYCEKILKILRDENLWNYLSKNAINIAKRLDAIEVAKQYLQLVNK